MSFIGYSLGCQVIKSTLKTLHYLKATNVVQNVTFLGAAVDLITNPEKPETEERWVEVLDFTISGSLTNIYTKRDRVLHLY
jgi:hypothetical protein